MGDGNINPVESFINTTYMDAHLDSAQILWGGRKGKIRNIVEPYHHVIQLEVGTEVVE